MIVTKYVDVEVDIELDDFDKDDIVQYCKDLGYHVVPEDEELEVESANIQKLFSCWLTLSPEKFNIVLTNFFRDHGLYK